MDADAQIAMELEEKDEAVEGGVAMETSRAMQEELAMAMSITPTTTPSPIYSTTESVPTPTSIPKNACSIMPTPIRVWAMELSVPQVPTFPTPIPTITNFNAIFLNTGPMRYAFGQCPHLSLTARQEDLGQSTLSAQAPLSCEIVALIQPFIIQLYPADMDFLMMKSGDAKERQKNICWKRGSPI